MADLGDAGAELGDEDLAGGGAGVAVAGVVGGVGWGVGGLGEVGVFVVGEPVVGDTGAAAASAAVVFGWCGVDDKG